MILRPLLNYVYYSVLSSWRLNSFSILVRSLNYDPWSRGILFWDFIASPKFPSKASKILLLYIADSCVCLKDNTGGLRSLAGLLINFFDCHHHPRSVWLPFLIKPSFDNFCHLSAFFKGLQLAIYDFISFCLIGGDVPGPCVSPSLPGYCIGLISYFYSAIYHLTWIYPPPPYHYS